LIAPEQEVHDLLDVRVNLFHARHAHEPALDAVVEPLADEVPDEHASQVEQDYRDEEPDEPQIPALVPPDAEVLRTRTGPELIRGDRGKPQARALLAQHLN